jgi:2-phosphosulfolactate phosphatase
VTTSENTLGSATPQSTAEAQGAFQVRFDWGVAGAKAIATSGADAIVWADQLGAIQLGAMSLPSEASGSSRLSLPSITTVHGTIQASAALAAWALQRQTALGGRFTIAVVAAGEPRDDGSLRFAVEDLLAAGAVIDALTAVGIDHCSPEAAAASAAYVGLSRASRHLITASVSGQSLGGPTPDLSPVTEVVILREFSSAD